MSTQPSTFPESPPQQAAPVASTPTSNPWPARVALLAILGLAAALRLWHLDQNGYGRAYYAAGVRSMLGGVHHFFYNSFDPAGFVSLDKPPIALWLQVASAKVLGFSAFSVMLPQVLEGVLSVALLYRLVAHRFGRTAALVAALCLALTPISVAVDRSNNTDSCLTLVLLLAAWAAIRAAETASPRLLMLAMAVVGLGFNVKMAAALVVVPAFILVYWLGAAGQPVRQRLAHVTVSEMVLAVVSLSWATAFDLTPADERPYAGSTQHNSMLELAVLHNGLDRFVQPAPRKEGVEPTGDASPTATAPASNDSANAPTGAPQALWDQTPIGPLRLASPHLAAQLAWLLPVVIGGLAVGVSRWRRRQPFAADQLSIVLWSGWAALYATVFSFAGGVFHVYYLAVLAPPVAALAGIGWAALWRHYREGSMPFALPIALLVTACWQFYIEQSYVAWGSGDWRSWLLAAPVGVLLLATACLLAPKLNARVSQALAACALVAMLAMPMAWALSTVLVRPNVAVPSADIAALARVANADDDVGVTDDRSARVAAARASARKFIRFLRSQHGGERFLVAVPNALVAAPIIVRTGDAVMAMGGYLGRDPILTTGALERMAANGELRFVMLGGFSLVRSTTAHERALSAWVRSHGTLVDPALWQEAPSASSPSVDSPSRSQAPAQLYDLRSVQAPGG